MSTIFDSDYIFAILIAFGFLTIASWPLFYLLRVFSLRVLPSRFSYWSVALWALLPFLFLYFVGRGPILLNLPFLVVGAVAGYILEKVSIYLLNRKVSGSYNEHQIRIFGSRRGSSHSASKSSPSPSSRSGRSDFGGGKFSGGGGSGTW